MRKYLHIYKSTLIENLNYIGSLVLGFINFFVMMYIFLNLWQYVYSDNSNVINGYSIDKMLWYVLFAEILWFGTRNKILINDISQDIKTGNIAYNINKPYNYIIYIIVRYLSEITIKFILFLIIGIAIGILFIGPIPNFNVVNIPFIAITVFLGTLINAIIRVGLSVLSFWIEDSSPFQWIYDKLILVVGTIFPIEMFPAFLQPIISCTPVYVITYGPNKLVIDFSLGMFINIFIAQIIYLIILIAIVGILYTKGVKKLNVSGG